MLVALILLLTYLDRTVQHVAAIIAGLGFGTFVDEIGKFLTADNDYFFRPAVALIYVIFVGLFLVGACLAGRRALSQTRGAGQRARPARGHARRAPRAAGSGADRGHARPGGDRTRSSRRCRQVAISRRCRAGPTRRPGGRRSRAGPRGDTPSWRATARFDRVVTVAVIALHDRGGHRQPGRDRDRAGRDRASR